jgi:hypothetical protein
MATTPPTVETPQRVRRHGQPPRNDETEYAQTALNEATPAATPIDTPSHPTLDSSLINSLPYITQFKTPLVILNKRLNSYMGCCVVNLSHLHINPNDLRTLSYGLSFCPTPTVCDKAALLETTERFFRKLKLKIFFHQPLELSSSAPSKRDSTTSALTGSDASAAIPADVIKRLNITSSWTPQVQDASLLHFMNSVRKSIQSQITPQEAPRSNLTATEREFILNLQQNKDVTIKKADKGNSIVIMSTVDYLFKALTQLNNRAFYEPQDADLTLKHEQLVNQLVSSWHTSDLIDTKVKNFLWAKKSKTARFYILPKIHKKGIPGRPIVSAIGCPTEHLSAFVDSILCPLVATNPSFI